MTWHRYYNKITFFVTLILAFGQDEDSLQVKKIGPISGDLPLLDSLVTFTDTLKIKKRNKAVQKIKTPKPKQYPINASGSFFRSVSMSSQGSGGLGGGLRFQLSGKLTDNINVSGTVTDETIPIQPDGTTAALEELDKVYINVSHPSANMTAGDISLDKNIGRYNNNSKKLIGIKNNINFDNTNYEAVIGQSKGRYNRMEIKGLDGQQGPYFLTSRSGERNIIIAAGSETVWLNGVKLMRGSDRDYTIDYSAGELTFTPKHLIYFDSDIDIEYQYRSSRYKTNFISADISKAFGENGLFQVAYIDENDDQSSAQLTADNKSLFKANDKVFRSGVVADSLGDYVLNQSIYFYRPTKFPGKNRYNIDFSPDPNGEYVRRISDQNRIYYEFVPTDGIDNRQRFAPGQLLRAPESHQLLQLNTTVPLMEGLTISTEGAFTYKDKNIFSSETSNQLNGSAFRFELNQQQFEIGKSKLEMGISHWQNGKNFRAIGRERAVDFNESWDVSDVEGINESISEFQTKVQFNSGLKSKLNFSRLRRGDAERERSEVQLQYQSELINKGNLRWNRVQSSQSFKQVDGHIQLFSGPLKPFLSIVHEMREDVYSFDDLTIGLKYHSPIRSLSFGLGEREDSFNSGTVSPNMNHEKTARTLYMDYSENNSSGWRQSWLYRKRLQIDELKNNKDEFSTIRSAINFRNRTNPIQLDIILNGQHGMNESKAVIYDSVGEGLGNYRYDQIINDYVQDENGSFVAQTVLTGEMNQGFRMDERIQFLYDFSRTKYPRLKSLKYRFNHRLNFHGSEAKLDRKIELSSIQLFEQYMRSEFIHRKKRESNRRRVWQLVRDYFNGMDPRGWEKRQEIEWGGESQIRLQNDYDLVFQGDIHEKSTNSEKNRIIGRNVKGSSIEIGLKNYRAGSFQWDSRLIFAKDFIAINSEEAASVQAHGIKTNWIQFVGETGRIEGRLDYMIVDGYANMPPEALRGLSNNKTLRLNITATMRLGQSISLNSSILYQDDNRYDGLIKMQGEVRAQF